MKNFLKFGNGMGGRAIHSYYESEINDNNNRRFADVFLFFQHLFDSVGELRHVAKEELEIAKLDQRTKSPRLKYRKHTHMTLELEDKDPGTTSCIVIQNGAAFRRPVPNTAPKSCRSQYLPNWIMECYGLDRESCEHSIRSEVKNDQIKVIPGMRKSTLLR